MIGMIVMMAASAVAEERDPLGYDQVLLPIYVGDQPGAHGSLWRSELTIRNVGDTPAQLFQSQCVFFCDCPAFITACTSGSSTPPNTTAALGFRPDQHNLGNKGRFLYISRTSSPQIAIALRIRDISRDAANFGTEVPVVRTSEFIEPPAHLLDIPTDDRYRTHLRIYGASSFTGTGEVRVRIYSSPGDDLLFERILSLRPPGEDARLALPGERPELPAYSEMPALTSGIPGATARVRVEIAPLSPGLRYWAFVAVTNNETQHVTLITPQ